MKLDNALLPPVRKLYYIMAEDLTSFSFCGGKVCYTVCVRDLTGTGWSTFHSVRGNMLILCAVLAQRSTGWPRNAWFAWARLYGRSLHHCKHAICKTCCRRILCERPEGAQKKCPWCRERIPGFPGRRARRRVAVSLQDLVASSWHEAATRQIACGLQHACSFTQFTTCSTQIREPKPTLLTHGAASSITARTNPITIGNGVFGMPGRNCFWSRAPEDSFSWLARIFASQKAPSPTFIQFISFIRLCAIWFWGCLLRFSSSRSMLTQLIPTSLCPGWTEQLAQLPPEFKTHGEAVNEYEWWHTGSWMKRVSTIVRLQCHFFRPVSWIERRMQTERLLGMWRMGARLEYLSYWAPWCFRSLALQILLLRFFRSIYPPISITHSFATSRHSPSETLKIASIVCWLSPANQDGQSTKPMETVDVPDVLSFKLFGRDMRTVQVHVGLKGPSTRQGCG